MLHHQLNFEIENDALKSIKRSAIDIYSLKGKTILVTGGTGFFGIWLLTCLALIKEKLGNDLRIITISRSSHKFIDNIKDKKIINSIEILEGDIKYIKIDESMKITHLVHMATTNASETFAGEDQLRKIELLHIGTKNIITQCGSTLEKVLFTSSGVAYGVNSAVSISEDDYTGPNTLDIGAALGIGKLTAEYIIAYYAQKYSYKYNIARCFAFAGQYLPIKLHYAFGNFINDYLEKKPIHIKSDGQDTRSYLYIGDAVAWLLKLLEEPKNCIYNVGSENAIKIQDLAIKIAKHDGANLKILIEKKYRQIDNFKRVLYIPNTNKIKSNYSNLIEWTNIDEIIEKMISKKN